MLRHQVVAVPVAPDVLPGTSGGPDRHLLALAGCTGGCREAAEPPRRRSPTMLRVALLVVLPILLVSVGTGLLLHSRSPAADRSPCPPRRSMMVSDSDYTLRIRPETGPGALVVRLCVIAGPGSAGPVRGWSATAESGGDSRTRLALAILPLGDDTAIGTGSLAPGRSWLLTFRLTAPDGRYSVMSTGLRT
ncbi:hypothetical protein [Plantactinospora sp. WMMB782]|uniref:hypothetical protein n=1 Tax=Plantactinospora sp. WMMB782 TaxID=3404121 RepID=UPI003B94EFC5